MAHPGDDGGFGPWLNGNSLRAGHRPAPDWCGMVGHGSCHSVAEFGMILRQSAHRGSATHADAAALARRFRGPDPDGYRAEFIRLVELADALGRQADRRQF